MKPHAEDERGLAVHKKGSASNHVIKRYNLALPIEMFNELQQLAQENNTSVVDLVRRFIKLGLVAVHVESTPGAVLILREGEIEREIMLLL